jgi:hypothetical protein
VKEKLIAFVLKRINWGKLLPTLFRMIAEGRIDELLGLAAPLTYDEAGRPHPTLRHYPLKRFYWWNSGKKTFTGAVLMGLGAGLETVCASFPEFAWSCPASRYVYLAGAFLTAVGLVDGGTRAPWPSGTPIPPEAKTR